MSLRREQYEEIWNSIKIIEAVGRQLYTYNKPNARIRAQQIQHEVDKIKKMIESIIGQQE